MKAFRSLEEIKEVAEKFTAGTIIPKRVLKGGLREKKVSHMLTWARDVYRLQGVSCQVFVVDFSEEGPEYFAKLRGVHASLEFVGNPYGTGGNHFIGNLNLPAGEQLALVNKAVLGLQVCNE